MRKLGTALVVSIALVGAMLSTSGGVAQAAAPPVTFGPKTDFPTGATPASVAAGDLNGDTFLDLAVVNYSASTVSVLLGDGTGGFGVNTEYATGTDPYAVAIGDLDADTFLDLAVTNYLADTVSVLLGDGTGGFAAGTEYPTGDGPYSVAFGDLDGDTFVDLTVANASADTVSVLLGDGLGGLGAKTDVATGTGPSSVAVEDLNGDTLLDVATANYAADTVSVLLGDGLGGFGANTEFPTGDGPYSMAMGDLDGDTVLDVVTSSDATSTVSVLLGDGSGGFGAKTDLATESLNMALAVGDMNGDTFLDVVVANYSTDSVSVLPGDGAGGFDARTDHPTGSTPRSVAVGDLNGDALSDVVTTSYYSSDTVSVLLNTMGPGIVVTPATGLVDGQTVDVVGSGWEPGNTVGLCQGVLIDPPGPANCDGGAYTEVTVDSLGAFTTTIPLSAVIDVPSVGGSVNCVSASNPCVVGAADGADVAGTAVAATLRFALPAGAPGAPTIIRNASAGNASATVSWTAPGSDGGSPVTGYVVTPYAGFFAFPPVVFGSTATTQTLTGLTNGLTYRFRVQASNAVGTSGYSKVTNPVTPAPVAPGPPTIIWNASAGDGEATVSWTAPGSDGGSPVTGYVVTPYVGFFAFPPVVFGSTATTQTVTGLTNGLTYRFRVQASNAVGTSGYSKVTNPVTPAP